MSKSSDLSPFTEESPCPICTGHDRVPRGVGKRCHGFATAKGMAFCSRDDGDGVIEADESGLFRHRIGRGCPCGREHPPLPDSAFQQVRKSPEVKVIGKWSSAQRQALREMEICQLTPTMRQVGAKRVRSMGAEWLGIPAVGEDCWTLLAIAFDGSTRMGENGKLTRRTIGRASLHIPEDTERGTCLVDVEGITDLLSALDKEFDQVITTNVGASGRAAYQNCREQLIALEPKEILIVRDLDEAGRRGRDVAQQFWHSLGVPVRQVNLPESLGPKGDLRDFLNTYEDPSWDLLVESSPLREPSARATASGADWMAAARSGEGLEELLKERMPRSPIPGFLDPEPHLHILSGKPKVGKTSFAIWIALAIANRARPWSGSPRLRSRRVLIISNEQPSVRVAQLLNRLHRARRRVIDPETRFANIVVLGKDLVQAVLGRTLQLDRDVGLPLLRAALRDAQDAGQPFGLVVLDSLSRLKPHGVEENDNDGMTTWLDELESIALEFKAYVLLIHHVGHAGREDARSAARGASAIGAVAAGLWSFDTDASNRRCRIVRVAGSFLEDAVHRFRVVGRKGKESHILFFRRAEASDFAPTDPGEVIKPGERLSSTELDWRILKMPRNAPVDRNRLSKAQRKRAQRVREAWVAAGLLRVEKGKGTTQLFSLVQADPSANGAA